MTIDTSSFTEELLDQASAWIVRLRSDQATERDQQDFASWLAESPQHQAAFDEMMVLWQAMGETTNHSNPQPSISGLLGKVSVGNSSASNDFSDQAIYTESPAKIRPSTKRGVSGSNPSPIIASFAALAASVAIVALVFLSSAPPTHQQLAPEQILYATPVGKQQRFTMEDGSILELNTDTQVAVSYNADRRSLQLIHGEAFFAVKPDSSRPFIVSAGAGQVTAVGTAFNIQLSPGGASEGSMLVAVTEGKVSVSNNKDYFVNKSTQPRPAEPIHVKVGQQSRVDEAGDISAVEPADLKLVGAWREKTLIFRASSLATALTELNRYLAHPVDVSDPSLQKLTVSGTFSLEEPETTLAAIVEAFQLQSYKNPFDDKTRLYLR